MLVVDIYTYITIVLLYCCSSYTRECYRTVPLHISVIDYYVPVYCCKLRFDGYMPETGIDV